MTEADWPTCTDPVPMLVHLGRPRTDRRLKFLLLACGRAIRPLLPFAASRRAVEALGDYLEDEATDDELADAAVGSESAVYSFGTSDSATPIAETIRKVGLTAAAELARIAGWGPSPRPRSTRRLLEEATYFAHYLTASDRIGPYPAALLGHRRFLSAPLIRDIYGNPFRSVTADPHWLTSTVVSLAQSFYTDRAFDRLPILADALEEAGCDDPDILGHLRGDGPHVRGCWVVDLVLGKE